MDAGGRAHPAYAGEPEISVAVASHERPLRLRWLLNALEEQTLARERFEIVVAHDSGPETETVLTSHPLATAGVLRHLAFAERQTLAGLRNAGWRATRAPLVAFTDDDCRPPEDWLEQILVAARRCPAAIVQGATEPDPDEANLLISTPFHRSVRVDPPSREAQTCNIVYPRALLEELGGFDEGMEQPFGEDTDLAQRARRAGALYVGAPRARTFHMVDAATARRKLRAVWRWRHVPYLVKTHPRLRRELVLRLFLNRSHAWLSLALVGLGLVPASPAFAVLTVGWVATSLPSYGPSLRGRLRSVLELPVVALIQLTEMTACAVGSARYRALVL